MLCRVFHKKKGVENIDQECYNNNSLSYLESSSPHKMPLQHECYGETTTTIAAAMMLTKSSSHKFHDPEGSTSNGIFPNLTPLQCNFMEMEEVGSMDPYGLMLDVELIEDRHLFTPNLAEKDRIFF